ncbi:damage-control phosphatase ARMT1 family protein [Streptomyces sp. NBC_01794]|uniref:damage-control phosphatase ARMT1 family protein n=1 Tax=Streptomyces sp. NBC_01794 TaxID=2975942 RepID=UPI0030865473|nr:damage-control phosphatase ARMT1 family protein [Streptomyces sp. NBC_01794]
MSQPTPADVGHAPVVVSNVVGSFAWGVLHDRHPALIERVRQATAYPVEQQHALDALLREIAEGGVVEALDDTEPDAAQWRQWGEGHIGRRWADVPFLWAESYFYRKLLAALGYFTPGPWKGIDPFAPFKRAELMGATLDAELAALDEIPRLPAAQRDTTLLHASLWGNRADLGFQLSAGDSGLGERATGLVVDDTAAFWNLLDGRRPGKVCLVADNAGPELLPDLVLADHLLTTDRASSVSLHSKPYPYYVSDATTSDVLDCLARMSAASGQASEIGERLRQAVSGGRLVLRSHPFACAPLPYLDMPVGLGEDFASATLTVMKGDLNYRRLVGDRHWPATTPFSRVTAYFPGPVAALRTLKSDVITGLAPHTRAELETTGSAWRTSGTHALVQVRT